MPALTVLPHEVRRASNEHQVESSAEGKTRGSRYAGRHRCSPVHRYGGATGGDRREPFPSVWHQQGGLTVRSTPTTPTPPGPRGSNENINALTVKVTDAASNQYRATRTLTLTIKK